jgi:hypothetical protein
VNIKDINDQGEGWSLCWQKMIFYSQVEIISKNFSHNFQSIFALMPPKNERQRLQLIHLFFERFKLIISKSITTDTWKNFWKMIFLFCLLAVVFAESSTLMFFSRNVCNKVGNQAIIPKLESFISQRFISKYLHYYYWR